MEVHSVLNIVASGATYSQSNQQFGFLVDVGS